MIAPESLYPTGKAGIWILFDLREERAVRSLHRLGGALAELGDFEAVDQDHMVLIVRPGGARRLEA
jgi:hypothetical protein